MRAIRRCAALLALLFAYGVPALAQEGASPVLAADHWAVRAAWRAEALGLAPGFFPAERGAPRSAVAAALEEAAASAGPGSPYEALANGWLDRFRAEFAEYRDGGDTALPLRAGGAIAAGWTGERGRLSPAYGSRDSRIDPVELPDRDGARIGAAATALLGRTLALHADAVLEDADSRLHRWEAVLEAGGVAISAGRSEVGYGPALSGGIVLSTGEPIGRLAVRTARPLRLPVLGAVTAHTFAARLDDGRHVERPWLWGARVAVRPHARISIGVNRAAIFGGDSVRTTFRSVAGMLVGVLSDGFENQVVSLDARWRLPTDRVVPATLYAEWGAEDGAGAWWDQPARTGGVFFPAVPGLPWAAAGVEATRFEACCGHGAWYTHPGFRGNWARGDRLLGHPLGGAGTEAAVYVRMEPPLLPLRLDGRVFARSRAAESQGVRRSGNLFAPAAAGRGVGGELGAAVRLSPAAELAARFFQDASGDLRHRRAEAEIRYRF